MYGQEWYDVVSANDFGEPGRYSNRWPADATELLPDGEPVVLPVRTE